MEKLNDIKLEIAAGKLEEAINCFLPIAQRASTEKYNEVVLLFCSYNLCRKNLKSGLVSYKKANKVFAQIANRLIMMLDDMPEC